MVGVSGWASLSIFALGLSDPREIIDIRFDVLE